MQAKLKERDGSKDAELRDVFEVMKLSEEKKMGRLKRGCVCFGSVEMLKRYGDGCVYGGVGDVFGRVWNVFGCV